MQNEARNKAGDIRDGRRTLRRPIPKLLNYLFNYQWTCKMKLKPWHMVVIFALCFVAIRAYDFWLYGQEIK